MEYEVYAFLEKWVEDNVVPTDENLRAEHAEALAAECYKDASDAGFSKKEVEEAVEELSQNEGLASYIGAAFDRAERYKLIEED